MTIIFNNFDDGGLSMENYNDAVNQIYSEKENEIIIGLTGRTGAGCSTAAGILKKSFDELEYEYFDSDDNSIRERKEFDIIKDYMESDSRWRPFEVIEGSCIILSYILEQEGGVKAFIEYLKYLQSNHNKTSFIILNFNELVNEINGLDYMFKEISEFPIPSIEELNSFSTDVLDKYYELYIRKLADYKNRFKKIFYKYSCYEEEKRKLQDEPPVKYHLYTYLLQKIANNIRASGTPYEDKLCQNRILDFAKRIKLMIELIKKYRKGDKIRICIDAIRNANESNYLKDVYRSYFLISISVDEKMRQKRLGKLDVEEQRGLDYVEYESNLDNGEIFYHQNIANCFEMADIHLVNLDEQNGRRLMLTRQLVKYITLMIHPGLVVPNDVERCMQLAYNLKYNSGCLSRQVGAIVTDSNFSVKSVGWNDVPNKQLECIYRDVHGYCKGNQRECYSQFEYDNETLKKIFEHLDKEISKVDLHGRKFSYCFKDIYNGWKGDKNQVFTRALHAEENAFLQISKYGGMGIEGGNLFCTASPCELCSKKAFQLGIKKIYYIDPYPGISQTHILRFGKGKGNPELHLFSGAIGEAYVRLYRPMLAQKDELELVTGINSKAEVRSIIDTSSRKTSAKDLKYKLMEVSLEFVSRESIESIRKVDLEVLDGEFDVLERSITWTGSSYDKSELIDDGDKFTLEDSKDQVSPYHYKINLNNKFCKGQRISYGIKTYLKDESQLMHEYLAQIVKYPIENLILRVIIPEKNALLDNVRYVRYADMKMEYEFLDQENKVTETKKDNKIIYELQIENPNLFYTYSMEWDFIKVKS